MNSDCVAFSLSNPLRWVILWGLVLIVGCSSGVDPISIHDPTIPTSDRRLIADGEDRVAAARAQYDDAALRLRRTTNWRSNLLTHADWPADATGLVTSVHRLVDARLALMELQVERAAIEIELAQTELTLLVARVAVRNDRAVYDLQALRDDVDDVKEDARGLDRQIMQQVESLDEVTQRWWQEYAAYAQRGGDVVPFYGAFDRPRR